MIRLVRRALTNHNREAVLLANQVRNPIESWFGWRDFLTLAAAYVLQVFVIVNILSYIWHSVRSVPLGYWYDLNFQEVIKTHYFCLNGASIP